MPEVDTDEAPEGCAKAALPPRTVDPGGCPYCAEPLPDLRPAQCPHCHEFLDAVMLRQSLEAERYKRCPSGVRGVAIWFKFQGGLTAFSGLVAASAGFGECRPDILPVGCFLMMLGLGLWRVGSGVRHGRRWGRSWAIGLSMLQVFSKGFLFGIACLATLNSAPARAYFADRD